MKTLKLSYVLGKINENYTVTNQDLMQPIDNSCRTYILFLADVMRTRDVLGPQTTSKVIIVPRSSQWKQQEFLMSKASSDIVNLLVIGESLSVDTSKVLVLTTVCLCLYKIILIYRNVHTFCTHIVCTPMVWAQTHPLC